jgi:hypothetical protein
VQLAEDLVRERPGNPQFMITLGEASAGLGRFLLEQGQPKEAVPLLQQAVEQQSATAHERGDDAAWRRHLSTYQLRLAVALGKSGQTAAALESLQAARATLEGIARRTARDSYDLACIAAQTSVVLGQQQSGLGEAEAVRATEALRQAIAAGYRDVSHLENDADLDPLRTRKDFQQLVAELKQKTQLNTH